MPIAAHFAHGQDALASLLGRLPPDSAAQKIVAERGEGSALFVVLAVAVTAGGGLIDRRHSPSPVV
jgi:hypothetical protein